MPDSFLTGQNKRSVFASGAILVAANLLPIIAVLELDWTVYDLIVLYWFEIIVVGLFNILRMILIIPVNSKLGFHLLKIAFVPFFAGHYGLVCVGLGGGLQAIFGKEQIQITEQFNAMLAGDSGKLFWPIFISHLFSFFWNYLGQKEFRKTTITRRMVGPYLRVVPIAAFVILAAMGCLKAGSPFWAVCALIGGKTILDLVIHVFLHLKILNRPFEGLDPGKDNQRLPIT